MATVGTQKSLGDGKSKDKPEPLDLSHHFSIMAQRRTESSVTKFIGGLSTTTFNLGPGFPFAGNFPLDTLEGAIAKPRRLPLHSVSGVTLPDTDTSRFTVPKVSMDSQSNNPDTEIDLSTALQYQASTGYPSLAAFIQDWAVNYQNQGNIPYKDPETLITCGALDGLAKSLMTFSDPGDNILVEEYVYISAKDNILPFGLGLAAVNIDQEGMSAKSLEHILGNWDETIQGKRPRLMYTVTLGQNPTGKVQSLVRKRKIYEICQKYDVLILEDDPYWSLQYNVSPHEADTTAGVEDVHSFLGRLAPSYLTIDIDGRVISLQTFTKIFAPGCRVGWIVAQPRFIDKLIQTTDGTTQNPSGFAEAALSHIITREWGIKGFVRWIEGLQVNYKSRRDVMCEVLLEGRDLLVHQVPEPDMIVDGPEMENSATGHHNHQWKYRTGDGNQKIRMYDFDIPSAGMYIWLKVNISDHPLSQMAASGKAQYSPDDIMLRLWNHLASPPYSLLTLPGVVFGATSSVKSAVNHLRLTFAAVPAADCKRASQVFVEGIKSFWQGKGWDIPSKEESMKLEEAAKMVAKNEVRRELRFRDVDDELARVVKHRFRT